MVRRAKDKKKRDTEARPPPERGQSLRKINQKPSPSPPKGTLLLSTLTRGSPQPREVQGTGAGASTAALGTRRPPGDTRRQRAQGPRGRERKTHGAASGKPTRAGGGRGPPKAEKGRKTSKGLKARGRSKSEKPQPPPALEGSRRPQSWVSAPSHEDPSTQRLEALGGHRGTRDARAQTQPRGPCAPLAGGCPGCVLKK